MLINKKLRLVSSNSKNKKGERFFIIAMLALPIIHFLLFWVYVNFKSILFAFQTQQPGSSEITYTFKNFEYVFKQIFGSSGETNLLKKALANTLITWAFSNVFMFLLSILWAFFLYKNIKLTGFFRVVFYIPTIISGSAVAAIFCYMIEPQGPLGQFFTSITNLPIAPDFLGDSRYSMITILLYIFWTGFCGNLILLSGAMSRVPKEVRESAILDGCGFWNELFHIVIPLIWPTLTTMLVLSIAGLFTASGPILLLYPDGGVQDNYTLSYWIYEQVKINGSYNVPSALGIVFTLIGLPIVLLVRKALNSVNKDLQF